MIQSGEGQAVVSARRRLIRGSFAAPAVLALHSGSALAAASNLRCLQTQIANPVYPSYTDAQEVTGTTYVRVQLHTAFDSSGVQRWYLSGSVIAGVAQLINKKLMVNVASFQPPLTTGQWREVTLNAGLAKLSTDLVTVPATIALGPKYVALRMTYTKGSQGVYYIDILGVVDGTTSGSAVPGTCWSSFVTSVA